jgi:hypothetical protein
MVGNEETFNINGRRDDDEYSLSFNPCRSRKLVDLSGRKDQGKIPSWEQSLVHEERIPNGEDFPPPFDESICQVSVLPEDSYHYLVGMGDYFRRLGELIGDFYDYDDDRLTPDQKNKAKKINMGKNQLESLLVSVSLL